MDVSGVDTTQVAVKTTIDGNVENESTVTTVVTAPSKIKINISKNLAVVKDQENSKEIEASVEKSTVEELPKETNTVLVAASIKPALQNRKLSNLPIVEKGEELSGLCSIM